MAILRGGSDTKRERINNRTIRRIGVSVKLFRLSGTTAVLPSLRSVVAKLELRRNGQTYVIFHDNLAVLARESMFLQAYEYLNSANAVTLDSEAGVGVYEFHPIMLDLGSPINVQGMDELNLEVTCTNAWVPAGYDPAKCSIDFQVREDIGVEQVIPQIKSLPVAAGVNNVRESLGDNITSIAFIHSSDVWGQAITGTNAIYTMLQIISDKYNVTDNMEHMVIRRASQFEGAGAANLRGRSFLYIPGPGNVELDNVQITATCNPANVLANENTIVYRTFVLDPNTANRAAAMESKHARRDHDKALKHAKSAQAQAS